MRHLFVLLFVISSYGFSQQRIGIDLNYRHEHLNSSISFHKVFAQNWLISGALSFGGKGKYSADFRDFSENIDFNSPWSEVNQPILYENVQYALKRYNVSNRMVSAQIGLGYFYSFDVKHGIRGHVFGQFGHAFNEVVGYYVGSNEAIVIRQKNTRHSIAAVSAEIYHTIHLWKKFTLYYGLKTPYYFKIDKTQFDPERKSDNFYGVEPELTLGLTYLMGDC
jgi:hypothetical protein